jgi:biotin-[acetyl-CoA-carboxylase] ligase BirA-like protein
VDSTNTVAKGLLKEYDHVVVSADLQTHGRGRNGKSWHGDAYKNVYISFGYRHQNHTKYPTGLQAMIVPTLSVLDVLRLRVPNTAFRCKYPNDVQARDDSSWKKISGSLVEHEFNGGVCTNTIIGIGLNTLQTTFPETITQPCTSLALLGHSTPIEELRWDIIQAVNRRGSQNPDELFQVWKRELDIEAAVIYVVGEQGQWTVREVLGDGRLLIQHNALHHTRVIDNGDTLRYND